MNIYDFIGGTAKKFKLGDLAIVKWPDSCHTCKDSQAEYRIGTIVKIVEIIKGPGDEYYHCLSLGDLALNDCDEGWYYYDRELSELESKSESYEIEEKIELID